MPNNDRVSERYYGKINSLISQQSTRRRIHWICRQTVGDTVLDVGCSQGIASILLAREGFRVWGIDLDEASLEYAREALLMESEPIRRKVDFQLSNIMELTVEQSFDTVVLGEILEHFAHPELLLQKAFSLLADGGRLIITVPYGFHPFHDHKQTFYAGNLFLLLEPFLVGIEMQVHDKYLYCAGKKKRKSGSAIQSVRAELMEQWLRLDCRTFAELEWQQYMQGERAKAASMNSQKDREAASSEGGRS